MTPSDPAVHHIDDAPSGVEYDVRLPSLGQWARYGRIPNPLIPLVLKIEWGELKHDEMTDEDRIAYLDLMDFAVAGMCEPPLEVEFVRGVRNIGTEEAPTWEDVRPAMPREDREYLWGVALRKIPVGGAKKQLLEALEKFRSGALGGEPAGNGSAAKPRPRSASRVGRR